MWYEGLERRAKAGDDHRLLQDAWTWYQAAYTEEMRVSYRQHRAAWDALRARERVVLACYCRDAGTCHRTVLAALLARMGNAGNGGELSTPNPQLGLFGRGAR